MHANELALFGDADTDAWRPCVCVKRTRYTAPTRNERWPSSTTRSARNARTRSSHSSASSSPRRPRTKTERRPSPDASIVPWAQRRWKVGTTRCGVSISSMSPSLPFLSPPLIILTPPLANSPFFDTSNPARAHTKWILVLCRPKFGHLDGLNMSWRLPCHRQVASVLCWPHDVWPMLWSQHLLPTVCCLAWFVAELCNMACSSVVDSVIFADCLWLSLLEFKAQQFNLWDSSSQIPCYWQSGWRGRRRHGAFSVDRSIIEMQLLYDGEQCYSHTSGWKLAIMPHEVLSDAWS